MTATRAQEQAAMDLATEFDRAWQPVPSKAGNAGIVCENLVWDTVRERVLVLVDEDGAELARSAF